MNLLEKIENAGVVGCGGAGFPTHVKLKGNFEYLIVNGAECEPLLCNDKYLMRGKASEIVFAASKIGGELNIPHVIIALKRSYKREIDALRQAVDKAGASVEILLLDSFYPAGDEQTIVYEATGRIVPPGGLPSQVGVVVQNAATMYAIYEAMNDVPLTAKYITVTGEVANPSIVLAPVGTSFRECIALSGGITCGDCVVISGGPMMGKIADLDNAVVTKTTSGIIVLPKDGCHGRAASMDLRHMLRQAKSACIQCSTCTELCPRHLLGHPIQVHKIMRKMAVSTDISGMLADKDILNAKLCCECGVCETYACPMGLMPRKINAEIKKALAASKVSYEYKGGEPKAMFMRDMRKAPTERIMYRLGINKYADKPVEQLCCAEPERVSIPLQMHIGAPAQPVVNAGDMVSKCDVIARVQDGKLGAVIHASIDGSVIGTDGRIVIVRK